MARLWTITFAASSGAAAPAPPAEFWMACRLLSSALKCSWASACTWVTNGSCRSHARQWQGETPSCLWTSHSSPPPSGRLPTRTLYGGKLDSSAVATSLTSSAALRPKVAIFAWRRSQRQRVQRHSVQRAATRTPPVRSACHRGAMRAETCAQTRRASAKGDSAAFPKKDFSEECWRLPCLCGLVCVLHRMCMLHLSTPRVLSPAARDGAIV